MRRKIQRFVRSFTRRERSTPRSGDVSTAAVLRRLAARSIPVGTVIDVGASDGVWSLRMMQVYPRAEYLCVEALPAHERGLRDFAAQHPNVKIAMVAAGNQEGKVNFYAPPDNPFGGAASPTPFGQDNVTVPMTTIDRLCESMKMPGPYLLKLDAHAFEVPILEGATKTLSQANLLIIEAYNFRFRPGMLLFYELCQYLEQRGFHCMDLMAPVHRRRDQVLWQMDLVFGRADRPEFATNTFD